MSEYIKPEKSIWKMADGAIWEGPLAELPKSNASLIAKAGVEVSVEYLKSQGWGKVEEKKAEAPNKKAAKKAPETKAVKPEDTEDK